MSLTVILLLMWSHLFADVILQRDWMAANKSKDSFVLDAHVFTYTCGISLIGLFVPITFSWIVLNFILHFFTDLVTYRATTILWKNDQRHWFFVVISVDQALHITALFTTYKFFMM